MRDDTMLHYPALPDSRGEDLHGLEHRDSADLVIFMAGNQFMVMEELIDAFKEAHPGIEKIFYETLPPGLALKQILSGGAIFKGDIIDTVADVYTCVSEKALQTLTKHGKIDKGNSFIYLHNRLTLMVPKENRARIKAVSDLAREDVRISQPDPDVEDIAHHIVNMYRDAGGDQLVTRIMEEKRAEGTTIFTRVHHRETPLRIIKGTVHVGPVWATEVVAAKRKGLPVDEVAPPPGIDQKDNINYHICKLKEARHGENADRFIEFILSKKAKEIYKSYGFAVDSGTGASAPGPVP